MITCTFRGMRWSAVLWDRSLDTIVSDGFTIRMVYDLMINGGIVYCMIDGVSGLDTSNVVSMNRRCGFVVEEGEWIVYDSVSGLVLIMSVELFDHLMVLGVSR